jgi:hypothetical protein
MALYAAAILWLTSRQSQVAPAALTADSSALPGSDIDPLVVLAWIPMLLAPVTAGIAPYRRHAASGSAPPAPAAARQTVTIALAACPDLFPAEEQVPPAAETAGLQVTNGSHARFCHSE